MVGCLLVHHAHAFTNTPMHACMLGTFLRYFMLHYYYAAIVRTIQSLFFSNLQNCIIFSDDELGRALGTFSLADKVRKRPAGMLFDWDLRSYAQGRLRLGSFYFGTHTFYIAFSRPAS